jgi:hypothetical protein
MSTFRFLIFLSLYESVDMFHVLITVYLLWGISSCQEIDLNICPNGLTSSPMDSQWPEMMPNRFEFSTEVTTIIETFEINQLFMNSYTDAIYFHDYSSDLQTFYDFQTNEILFIENEMNCDRIAIQSNEYFPFISNQILKPSVLLGFDGRNNYNNQFFTRYIGEEKIRDGILTKKFQSCFFLAQQNLTINATYYLNASPRNQARINTAPDFVQIDVRSNGYPYSFNIIRFESNPSLRIKTPPGVHCLDRTNTKELPKNLPTRLSLHTEIYKPPFDNTQSNIESLDRFYDEALEFERITYNMDHPIRPSDRVLIDHSANLTYMYTRETQQCVVNNIYNSPMESINGIMFQFATINNSIPFQYTGITTCAREHVQCHRWIGQRDSGLFVQRYEWHWTAKYNHIDLQELIPIKLNIETISKMNASLREHQEYSKLSRLKENLQ